MGDAHRAVGGVDALPAGAAGAHDVDLEVLVADLDVDVLGLGQHGHRGGGGVDPPLGLGGRHALDPVHAALVLQPAVDLVPRDGSDDLLDALGGAVVQRQDLGLPVVALGVAAIEPEEVGGEERSLLAARAGADLEQDVLVVVGIPGQQQDLESVGQLHQLRAVSLQLLLGQVPHLRVAHHLLVLGDALLGVAHLAVGLHDVRDFGPLLGELEVLVAVADHLGLAEQPVQLHVARLDIFQLLEHRQPSTLTAASA